MHKEQVFYFFYEIKTTTKGQDLSDNKTELKF